MIRSWEGLCSHSPWATVMTVLPKGAAAPFARYEVSACTYSVLPGGPREREPQFADEETKVTSPAYSHISRRQGTS